jgi:hypothetical protein
MFSFIQTERYASFDFRLHQWTNYIHIRRKKVNQYSKINAILKSGCFLARETDICQVPWVVGRGELYYFPSREIEAEDSLGIKTRQRESIASMQE